MVRVFEIPRSLMTEGYLHRGGQPFTFLQVDWFDAEPPKGLEVNLPLPGTPEWRAAMSSFIRAKRYFRAGYAYLVLHPEHTFTIDYEGK